MDWDGSRCRTVRLRWVYDRELCERSLSSGKKPCGGQGVPEPQGLGEQLCGEGSWVRTTTTVPTHEQHGWESAGAAQPRLEGDKVGARPRDKQVSVVESQGESRERVQLWQRP